MKGIKINFNMKKKILSFWEKQLLKRVFEMRHVPNMKVYHNRDEDKGLKSVKTLSKQTKRFI